MIKLDSNLAKIEYMKKEVYESKCEVASLTNKVKTSNNHHKLASEALDKANLENTDFRDPTGFLETQLSSYIKEVKQAKANTTKASEETIKDYIANFHLMEEY